MKMMKRQSQFPQPSNPRVLVCGDGAGANIALRFAAKVKLFSQRHHRQEHQRHNRVYRDFIKCNITIIPSLMFKIKICSTLPVSTESSWSTQVVVDRQPRTTGTPSRTWWALWWLPSDSEYVENNFLYSEENGAYYDCGLLSELQIVSYLQ